MWLILGGFTLVAALRAHESRRARYMAGAALGVLFIAFGAVVNALYLAIGNDYYTDFADASPFPFVRDTWHSLVLPNQGFFIGLLIVFEATVGVLVLSGDAGPKCRLDLRHPGLLLRHADFDAHGPAVGEVRRDEAVASPGTASHTTRPRRAGDRVTDRARSSAPG